jgi:hypothetical protein
MNPSFRSLVIDLLDSDGGIPESTYQKLIEFADRNCPNQCDDIWPVTNGAYGHDGYCVYLEKDVAAELRNDADEIEREAEEIKREIEREVEEIQRIKDEKNGLYPDKIDIAN